MKRVPSAEARDGFELAHPRPRRHGRALKCHRQTRAPVVECASTRTRSGPEPISISASSLARYALPAAEIDEFRRLALRNHVTKSLMAILPAMPTRRRAPIVGAPPRQDRANHHFGGELLALPVCSHRVRPRSPRIGGDPAIASRTGSTHPRSVADLAGGARAPEQPELLRGGAPESARGRARVARRRPSADWLRPSGGGSAASDKRPRAPRRLRRVSLPGDARWNDRSLAPPRRRRGPPTSFTTRRTLAAAGCVTPRFHVADGLESDPLTKSQLPNRPPWTSTGCVASDLQAVNYQLGWAQSRPPAHPQATEV